MTFADQVQTDLEKVIDTGERSQEITYTPAADPDNSVIINAIVFAEAIENEDDEDGQMSIRNRRVVILTSESKGIETPAYRDKLTMDSEDWLVESIETKGSGKATLTVIAAETISKHHEGHVKRIGS